MDQIRFAFGGTGGGGGGTITETSTNAWTGTNSFALIRSGASDTFTTAVNTAGLLFGTTTGQSGIEFVGATASNGSGVRLRTTGSNFLIDFRSASASFTNKVSFDFSGNVTFAANISANGGITLPAGAGLAMSNYLMYSPSGTTTYFRDGINGRMHVWFDPGADATSAQFTVDSLFIVKGNVSLEDVNMVLGTTTGTKVGTATGQKLGFWGATPVVQQVLATGGGATADNIITLLQTLGLCKQS